ncbi:MAG TPA: PH domain-containing protein [Solirubrobacteraceae bacterium]
MDRHIYRKRGALAFGLTVAVLVTAGCAVDALLSTQTKYWIGDGVIPATVWMAVILASRVGVHVEPGGVRIVNILRRHRLRWDEIERFDLAPAGVYPLAGRVVLKSGRGIPIEGITVPRLFTEQLKPNAQKPIDALNALLASARERGQTT